jgi:hypothetical protein
MPTFTSQPDGNNGNDASIYQNSTGVNYGTRTVLDVGNYVGGDLRRAMLKFDLSSISSAKVVSAKLYLTVDTNYAGANSYLYVYRQKLSWVESQVTWNSRYSGVSWNLAGGFGSDDCEQSAIGSVATQGVSGTVEIALTTQAIQDIADGTFINNGFLLRSNEGYTDYVTWHSSDSATPSYRPKIVIEYILGGQVIIWSSE